jgi:hypothetical protein
MMLMTPEQKKQQNSIHDNIEQNQCPLLLKITNDLKNYPGNVVAISSLSKMIGNSNHNGATLELWLRYLNAFLLHIDGRGDVAIKRNLISKLNKNVTETAFKTDTSIKEKICLNDTFKSNRGKPRLVLLTCIWKRPELTDIILRYYEGIKDEYRDRVEIILICVGSEKMKSRLICEKYNCVYLEYANEPLSKKWGFGLKAASKYDPDGVVTLGSDDLVSKNTIERYIKCIQNNELFLGFYDIYFYSKKHSLIHWDGYGYSSINNGMPGRTGETIGAGRFYSKHLLNYIEYNLWGDLSINSGLDFTASRTLEQHGILRTNRKHAVQLQIDKRKVFFGQIGESLSDSNCFILDVKTNVSLTSLSRYTGSPHHYIKIPEKKRFLLNHFSEETISSIFRVSTQHQ